MWTMVVTSLSFGYFAIDQRTVSLLFSVLHSMVVWFNWTSVQRTDEFSLLTNITCSPNVT